MESELFGRPINDRKEMAGRWGEITPLNKSSYKDCEVGPLPWVTGAVTLLFGGEITPFITGFSV